MIFGGKNVLVVVCKTKAGQQLFFEALGKGHQQVFALVLETLEEETKLAAMRFLDDPHSSE